MKFDTSIFQAFEIIYDIWLQMDNGIGSFSISLNENSRLILNTS